MVPTGAVGAWRAWIAPRHMVMDHGLVRRGAVPVPRDETRTSPRLQRSASPSVQRGTPGAQLRTPRHTTAPPCAHVLNVRTTVTYHSPHGEHTTLHARVVPPQDDTLAAPHLNTSPTSFRPTRTIHFTVLSLHTHAHMAAPMQPC